MTTGVKTQTHTLTRARRFQAFPTEEVIFLLVVKQATADSTGSRGRLGFGFPMGAVLLALR